MSFVTAHEKWVIFRISERDEFCNIPTSAAANQKTTIVKPCQFLQKMVPDKSGRMHI